MRNSRILPMPNQEIPEWGGSHWSRTAEFLSPDECQSIIDWAEKSELDWAGTVGYDMDKRERTDQTDFDHRLVLSTGLPDDEFGWFYDRLANEVLVINDLFWRFDIRGLYEEAAFLKYTHFDEKGPGKFNWHSDVSGTSIRNRKISCIVQLSGPEDYDGCELQFFTGQELTCPEKDKGTLISFPSYAIHRVTPITRGTRYSVVLWVTGPPFC